MGSARVQGDLWGKAPQGWAEIQEPAHEPLWQAMLEAAQVSAGTSLLDAGCGAGGAARLAAERGAAVSGLDAAEGLLAFARASVPDAEFRVGDIQELPYEDDTFDAVIAANSIQYTSDRVASLRELRRVCKPGGRIVASLFGPPEKVAFAAIFKALGNAMPGPPKGGGPFELSMPGKLEELFAEAGLEVSASGEVNCPFLFADFESFWIGNAAAGPVQGMLQVVSQEHLQAALRRAVIPFTRQDGQIRIEPNTFIYVTAVAPA